jgi:hypothetical protein
MRLSVRIGIPVVLALVCLAFTPASADDGQTVVVTKPGVVFHKAGAGDLRGRAVERTVDAALEAGYSPCPVCFAKELSAARIDAPDAGGAATAQGAVSADSIPAPPVSTVTQPFGLRYASKPANTKRGGVHNPYDDLLVVIPGRAEQGAYGDR